MLRARAWDALRRATPVRLRGQLKRSRWFTPLTQRLFGNSVYSDSYYADIERIEASSAPCIARWIAANLAPRRLLDVGCGSGLLMAALRDCGIDVRGVDLSPEGVRWARKRGLAAEVFDLTAGLALPGTPYDVVTSCEVAEHLEPQHAEAFVAHLVGAAPVIYLTAAEPNPAVGPGLYHFNEQPNDYWIALMKAQGFALDQAATNAARKALAVPEVIEYLQRPMVFRRAE